MAEAKPKRQPTYEEHRERLLNRIPEFMIPFQLGPGVSFPVSLREMMDQLVPRTKAELAIGVPLTVLNPGAAFGKTAPEVLRMANRLANKSRIVSKMISQNEGLARAAELLEGLTGKMGSLDASQDLAASLRRQLQETGERIPAEGLPMFLNPDPTKISKIPPTELRARPIGRTPGMGRGQK